MITCLESCGEVGIVCDRLVDRFGRVRELAVLRRGGRAVGVLVARGLFLAVARRRPGSTSAWVDLDLVVGEDGLFFWNTEAAPPARALSSPITLPPSTPPEPLKVWAMLCGAK